MMEWLFDDGAWLFQVAQCVGYGTCFDFSVWQKTVSQNVQKKNWQKQFLKLAGAVVCALIISYKICIIV